MRYIAATYRPQLHDITIAATRISFAQRLIDTEISTLFRGFNDDGVPYDLTVRVASAGECEEGVSSEPGLRWRFHEHDGELTVERLDGAGGLVWRMVGSDDFSEVLFSSQAQRFAAIYKTFGRSLTAAVGFLLLGMRLRSAGGVMLHGAGFEFEGNGIICTGVSGVGKSTIAQLFATAGATMLTDERSVIRHHRVPENHLRLYGTPWPSSAGFACNASAALRRIYFLEHGACNELIPLTSTEAIRRLIPVSMIPWQAPKLLDPFLATLEEVVGATPVALLRFKPTPEVVELVRDDLERS